MALKIVYKITNSNLLAIIICILNGMKTQFSIVFYLDLNVR